MDEAHKERELGMLVFLFDEKLVECSLSFSCQLFISHLILCADDVSVNTTFMFNCHYLQLILFLALQ